MESTTVYRFFSPIRIISIIAILSAFQIIKIPWQSEQIIFYLFFPVIAGSVMFEAIFHDKGFKQGLKETSAKYYSGVSIQFVGSAVSALASFNTDPEKVPIIIMYTLLLLAMGWILEAFHVFTTKKLKKVKASPIQKVLAVFGLTILIFILGLYTVFELVPRTTWFS